MGEGLNKSHLPMAAGEGQSAFLGAVDSERIPMLQHLDPFTQDSTKWTRRVLKRVRKRDRHGVGRESCRIRKELEGENGDMDWLHIHYMHVWILYIIFLKTTFLTIAYLTSFSYHLIQIIHSGRNFDFPVKKNDE